MSEIDQKRRTDIVQPVYTALRKLAEVRDSVMPDVDLSTIRQEFFAQGIYEDVAGDVAWVRFSKGELIDIPQDQVDILTTLRTVMAQMEKDLDIIQGSERPDNRKEALQILMFGGAQSAINHVNDAMDRLDQAMEKIPEILSDPILCAMAQQNTGIEPEPVTP